MGCCGGLVVRHQSTMRGKVILDRLRAFLSTQEERHDARKTDIGMVHSRRALNLATWTPHVSHTTTQVVCGHLCARFP